MKYILTGLFVVLLVIQVIEHKLEIKEIEETPISERTIETALDTIKDSPGRRNLGTKQTR